MSVEQVPLGRHTIVLSCSSRKDDTFARNNQLIESTVRRSKIAGLHPYNRSHNTIAKHPRHVIVIHHYESTARTLYPFPTSESRSLGRYPHGTEVHLLFR